MKVSFSNFILNSSCAVRNCTTPFLGRGKIKQSPKADVFEKSKTYSKVLDTEKKHNPGVVKRWARNLEADATRSSKVFAAIMSSIFWEICEFPDGATYNFPQEGKNVGYMKLCTKSPNSILEKMLTKGNTTEREAREGVQDALRGRIVLNNGTLEEGDAVLAKLTNAVKKKNIEIKKIKFYYTGDGLNYVSNAAINNLKKAIDRTYGKDSYSYMSDKKTSGYNGVHIIFKVDNDFDAELQIIGSEVEKLKDVEDVFYKLRNNKHVDQKYKEIETKFNRLKLGDKEKLNAYTREAYIAQRQKELGIYEGKYKDSFVPLDESYGLPKIFDFNYIATL